MKHVALTLVFVAAGNYLAAAESGNPPLQLQQTILLPGVEGRIDHFAFDAAGERLFVCALGNNTVEVVGIREGTWLLCNDGTVTLKGQTGARIFRRSKRPIEVTPGTEISRLVGAPDAS